MVPGIRTGDSGVETEGDGESNDSSTSSPGNANVLEVSAQRINNPVSSSSLSFGCVTSSTSSYQNQFSSQFPRPPHRDESLDNSFTYDGASTSSTTHHHQMSSSFGCASSLMTEDSSSHSVHGASSAPQNSLMDSGTQPEDGYLGDCSSDGGNEKNFPLPADWRSGKENCSCHPSKNSLPPSPASSHQNYTETSPGAPSSPPTRMEDMEPPAGLHFSNLTQSPDNGGSSYGYQVNTGERNHGSLKMKVKSRTGLRSRYNAGVEQDWARIKSAIADRKLRMAASHNNSELVERLCANGANVRCFDEHKRTPLHFAASMGYSEVTEILLKYGADPNQKDKLGNTALHLAACTSHVPVVTLLLRAGTDLTTIDNNGRTPMQLAQAKLKILQRSSSSHTEMFQVKNEVSAVLDMMREYLKKVLQSRDTARSENSEAFSQLIESFSQRLDLHTTHSDLSTDLGNLLQSMGTLSIKQNS